jgi:hypothetical protein
MDRFYIETSSRILIDASFESNFGSTNESLLDQCFEDRFEFLREADLSKESYFDFQNFFCSEFKYFSKLIG